jgi:hypothetical protein
MDAVDHDLTAEQWARLKDAWEGCAYCGATNGALQRDCVMAISRGGRYTIDNVVPACAKCNTSKCNDEVTGWLRRKRLDERAFLLRHMEISTAFALPPYRGCRPFVSTQNLQVSRHSQARRDVAELVGSDDLSVGGSAEVRDCFGTQAVTGTWTSRRR